VIAQGTPVCQRESAVSRRHVAVTDRRVDRRLDVAEDKRDVASMQLSVAKVKPLGHRPAGPEGWLLAPQNLLTDDGGEWSEIAT
jgi:hypothetical protein